LLKNNLKMSNKKQAANPKAQEIEISD